MICEKVLGNIKDVKYQGYEIDYVEMEWEEVFKRLHSKITKNGREIGIRFGDEVLTKGLLQGDVLYQDENGVIAVDILECDMLSIVPAEGHEHMLIKAAYEIGNRHAPLFWGKGNKEILTPYNAPMERLLTGIHGITSGKVTVKPDIARRISSTGGHSHGHTHSHSHE